eukprot:scaffold301_cov243-Pinguiococcus_pyrenoidosus.AAC.60
MPTSTTIAMSMIAQPACLRCRRKRKSPLSPLRISDCKAVSSTSHRMPMTNINVAAVPCTAAFTLRFTTPTTSSSSVAVPAKASKRRIVPRSLSLGHEGAPQPVTPSSVYFSIVGISSSMALSILSYSKPGVT